jgi:hypothetical protein
MAMHIAQAKTVKTQELVISSLIGDLYPGLVISVLWISHDGATFIIIRDFKYSEHLGFIG